ncbi:PREDICTED: uncharacterized protein LOC109586871 [Amphimedon queenslandica]|uniref:Uncharacterized protein n=1 Tax=Amphimedon queenslandica TaxID=400682 RepID=A0AAN0JPA0_AMPQE|nr:PREDICTED: uncharacterized protein LOC109586871 [Amphimedon queenslandica]|eukprot:XP_019858659.1 PREDICTED: uncharacterized protein LOC109586871 [Amphimedon queenslandica]
MKESNGRNEHFNITGSYYRILSVSTSGVYNVSVYYLNNGSIYGPAVHYHSLVEIIIINTPSPSNTLSTINAISSESIEATLYHTFPTTVSTEHTPMMAATPDSTPMIQLLYTVSSVVGSVILFLIVTVSIIIVGFWIRRRPKKNNELTQELITNNPA